MNPTIYSLKIPIMKKISFFSFLFALVVFILSGCLTVEKKEYKFELTGENSGKLTIKYINILSVMDDTLDVSEEDFQELLSSYLYGESIETDYPEATNIEKRIFEEDGVLCAEVTMEFEDISAVKLFQYDPDCPYMLNLGSFMDTETYLESNGSYGGEDMPVVFWPSNRKIFTVTTQVTTPDETTISMVSNYRDWKNNR
jgi:hypothetical protein